MGFITVFTVVSKDGKLIDISDSTTADVALRWFSEWGKHGQLVSVFTSESAAAEARALVKAGQLDKAQRLLKLTSHSMTFCGDVT